MGQFTQGGNFGCFMSFLKSKKEQAQKLVPVDALVILCNTLSATLCLQHSVCNTLSATLRNTLLYSATLCDTL